MDPMKYGYDGSGDIYKILKQNGITDIMHIFALTKDEIKELIYEEEEEILKLNLGQYCMIHALIAYNVNHIQEGASLKIIDWLSITHDQFTNFRIIYNPAEYFTPTVNKGFSPQKYPTIFSYN